MNANETTWDPLRKKLVALTPEEIVRQWFIKVLHESASVPMHMMMSEVEMKYGSAGKIFRADILVYDRMARPLTLVECKRPDVQITAEVLSQALKYDMVLDVDYIFITNGEKTFAFGKAEDGFRQLDRIPSYEEMICQR